MNLAACLPASPWRKASSNSMPCTTASRICCSGWPMHAPPGVCPPRRWGRAGGWVIRAIGPVWGSDA
eukprot:7994089-Pyramimonas_sp.AAC.1